MKTLILSFPAYLCLIVLGFTTTPLHAQCTCEPYNDDFDIETSSGETADDYDMFDGAKVLLNYDFTIDINFTIDASTVAAVPGVTIFVQSPNTLTITGGSVITANTTLWDGIHVDDGAHIIINEASEISNAYRGVWIDNNATTAADFDITDHSFFCNNDVGLYIDGYTGGLHPGFIEETEFCAPNLLAPLSGELGTAGIVVRDFLTTNNVIIGDGDPYTPTSDFNYFHELQNGIYAYKASVEVLNNYFDDIRTTTYDGCGIKAESETNYPAIITVGEIFAPTGSISNAFEQCDYGLSVETAYAVNAYSNRFGKSSASQEIFRNGIDIRGCAYNHFLENNIFINNDRFAIFMSNNTNADIDILNNDISSALSLTTSYVRTGIYVSNSTPISTLVQIEQNDISGIQTGIIIRNISDYAEIRENEIDFDFPGGSNEARGILVENCYDILIEENLPINGNCTPTCTDSEVRGIEIQSSEDFRCFKNEIDDCAYGILIYEDNEGGNLVCNVLTDCRYGFGLKSLGDPALLGPVHGGLTAADPYPSDNSWFPSTGSPTTWSNRSVAFGSPGTFGPSVDWWYRDSGGNQFDMEDAGTALNLGLTGSTALDPIIPTPLIIDPCDFEMPYDNFTNSGGGNERLAHVQFLSSYFTKLNGLIEEDATDSPEWYFLIKRAWHLINSENENISSEDKAILQDLMDNTTLDTQYRIFNALNNFELETAAELLQEFTPITSFDQNIHTVLSIYLDAIDTTAKVLLTTQDSINLLSIAIQQAFEAGIAVHIARGLLDTIITNPIEIHENKLLSLGETKVYPNPVLDWLHLSYTPNNDVVTITLTNLLGQVVIKQQITCFDDIQCSIYVGNLANGCYTFAISSENVLISKGKFLKF